MGRVELPLMRPFDASIDAVKSSCALHVRAGQCGQLRLRQRIARNGCFAREDHLAVQVGQTASFGTQHQYVRFKHGRIAVAPYVDSVFDLGDRDVNTLRIGLLNHGVLIAWHPGVARDRRTSPRADLLPEAGGSMRQRRG